MRGRDAVRAAWIVGLAGCGTVTEADPRACQPTHEFGNTGCFRIEGQVVGERDQPLRGIAVGTRYLPGREYFNTVFAYTDTAGRFGLSPQRFWTSPPAEPDTVTLYVRAMDPSSSDLGLPATVRDSVLVRVTIAPVGAIPEVATVRLRLPIP